jgi:hypothetical protein
VTPPLTMAEVAAVAGVHYDTFRKGWREMVRKEGLPAPFRTRPYKWSPEPLQAWRESQAEALERQTLGHAPEPANDVRPARIDARRERALRRMGG